MAQITEVPPPGKRKSAMRELVETVVLALLIAFAIRTFIVEVYRVEGSSMQQTLSQGERVLVNKFIYRYLGRQPEPGDIIVFAYPREPDRDFIKRVIAVAGDKVELKAGKVYVNGKLFAEAPTVLASVTDYPEAQVPEDSVWVLGDNRNNSEDSRFFGEVPIRNIRGQAFYRIWPFTRISGFINPVEEAAKAAR